MLTLSLSFYRPSLGDIVNHPAESPQQTTYPIGATCGLFSAQSTISSKSPSLQGFYFFSLAMISSATFLPDISIPPKIGPIRGVPETAEAAIPQT